MALYWHSWFILNFCHLLAICSWILIHSTSTISSILIKTFDKYNIILIEHFRILNDQIMTQANPNKSNRNIQYCAASSSSSSLVDSWTVTDFVIDYFTQIVANNKNVNRAYVAHLVNHHNFDTHFPYQMEMGF